MNETTIRKFLEDEFPWYMTDASISLLRGATNVDELRETVIRLGRDQRLIVNAAYEAYVREYYSIYAFEEFYGEASRQERYVEKAAKDKTSHLAKLRADLRNVRIVNAQGERLDVTALSLVELEKAKADIADHLRMKAMPANELRTEYLKKHPAPARRGDGYPTLPQQMVLPAGLKTLNGETNGIHATAMTPELIHLYSRSKSDSAEWHFYKFRLVRAYGVNQINERSQQPVGAGE
jgi:hypothetical protein